MNRLTLTVVACLSLAQLSGCSTIRGLAGLREVDFSLDRVADLRLAGVDMSGVRSYTDIGAFDVVRLTTALARREMPMSFTLHVGAENPRDNAVSADLVRLDWTLFLQDRETISGALTEPIVLPPGQPTTIPVSISLDLVEFFDANVADLAELALSIAGQGGEPKSIALRAKPTIDTALGPITYPKPLTIVSKTVG